MGCQGGFFLSGGSLAYKGASCSAEGVCSMNWDVGLSFANKVVSGGWEDCCNQCGFNLVAAGKLLPGWKCVNGGTGMSLKGKNKV